MLSKFSKAPIDQTIHRLQKGRYHEQQGYTNRVKAIQEQVLLIQLLKLLIQKKAWSLYQYVTWNHRAKDRFIQYTAMVLEFCRARPVHQDLQRHKPSVVETTWDIILKIFFSSFTKKEPKFFLSTRLYTHMRLCAVPMYIWLSDIITVPGAKTVKKKKQQKKHPTFLKQKYKCNFIKHIWPFWST